MTSTWDRFWYGEASLVRLAVFRMVMMFAAFEGVWRFRIGVLQHAQGVDVSYLARSWNPIYVFELLGVQPPGPVVGQFVFWTLMVSITCGLVGLFTRTACALTAVLTFYWFATHYSFGKPHHDAIQLTFGLWALPLAPVGARLSIDALARRARSGIEPPALPVNAPWAALPLRVTQVSLALGYFFSGATKLAVGGIGWANGYTLQAIMLEYRSPWSGFLAQNVLLCQLMQVGLLFVQVSFPLIFLSRRLRWFYVPAAIVFHLVAMKTMATGSFITLWFTLAAFVAWERAPAFLLRRIFDGALWQRLLVGAPLVAFAWFTYALYFENKPGWLGLSVVPFALLLIRSLRREQQASRAEPV